MRVRQIITLVIAVCVIALLIGWYSRRYKGIYTSGQNAVIIRGECIVINWSATEAEAEAALVKWQQLKSK